MPKTLKQTLSDFAQALEQQNSQWRHVRLALEALEPEARVAVDPDVLFEIDDLCRPRAPVAPRSGALRA